jgi:hypothetical protein
MRGPPSSFQAAGNRCSYPTQAAGDARAVNTVRRNTRTLLQFRRYPQVEAAVERSLVLTVAPSGEGLRIVGPLWFRRGLVRAQEGQVKAPSRITRCGALYIFEAASDAERHCDMGSSTGPYRLSPQQCSAVQLEQWVRRRYRRRWLRPSGRRRQESEGLSFACCTLTPQVRDPPQVTDSSHARFAEW